MPYASQMDLENTYGVALIARLADTDSDGQPEQETIDGALESASSLIDSYLSIRYPVPITPPTPVLRDLCVDIALYRMAYSRLKQTVEMRQRYDDAVELLKLIGSGKASIGRDTSTETDDGSADGTGDGGGEISGKFSARTRWLKRA